MLYVEGNSVLLYIFLYLVFRIQMTRINMCFLLSWESTSKVWYAVLLCNKHPLRRLCRAQSPLSGLQSLSQAWCPCLPPPLRRRCCAKRLRCAPQQATTLERSSSSCRSIRRPRWFQRHIYIFFNTKDWKREGSSRRWYDSSPLTFLPHRIDERLEELQQHMQYLNMDKKEIQITFSRVFKTAHDSGQSPERIHSIQCIRIVRNRILADIEDTCKISIVISPLLWYNKRVMKSR